MGVSQVGGRAGTHAAGLGRRIRSAERFGQRSCPAERSSGQRRKLPPQSGGEWIGTCVQSTDAKATDNKYFHAIIKQSGPATYETVFEYYRLDPQTGAPITVGATTMATTVADNGTATNRVIGQADVLIDPKTLKPEQHDLSEVLRVSPSGGLEGTGSGTIKVSGMPLGAGKSGRVRDYRSTWSQTNGVLSLNQRLKVKFKVLFFSKSFAIIADYTARRGSDIVGLMKSASASTSRVGGAAPG
jgi:hypothetical protein